MSGIEDVLRAGPAEATGRDRLDETVTEQADHEGLVDVAWTEEDTPIGHIVLAATEKGLVTISYRDADATLAVLAAKVSPRVLELPRRLDAARHQLDEYFAGERTEFELPLDLALSAGFRRKVLRHLGRVPYGEVVTYKDLAVKAGSPAASRAVGTTMATNPIPIVLPCHRVIRTGGDLGGYGGGLDAKRALLALEGGASPLF